MSLQIIGAELLTPGSRGGEHVQFKAVLNESGIFFFSAANQHARMKQPGLSYEDDYKGNALAAVLDGTKCEIRWHKEFSDARVKALWQTLIEHPALAPLAELKLSYQGRPIEFVRAPQHKAPTRPQEIANDRPR